MSINMVVAYGGCHHQLYLAALQELLITMGARPHHQHVSLFDVGCCDGGTTEKDDLVSKLTDRLSDIGYLIVNNYLHDSSLHDA
jgi:hypothetical protein